MDISLGELLLIVAAAVIFVGPKELPAIVRAASKAMRAVRSLTSDIRKAFDDLADESGLKEAAADIRLIKGDDGQFYESYDASHIPAAKKGE